MTQRILLADDEPHIMRAAEFKLKRQGFHVRCACDGEDAWEKIQQDLPQLLVTDLQMPRLSGLELVARLRADARFRDLPAILLTAKGFELSEQELIAAYGLVAVVSKPFSPRELCQRVQAALEQNPRAMTTAQVGQGGSP